LKESNQVDANGNIVSIGDYIDAAGNKVFSFNDAAQILQSRSKKIQLVRVL
jgi:hypothetical protein